MVEYEYHSPNIGRIPNIRYLYHRFPYWIQYYILCSKLKYLSINAGVADEHRQTSLGIATVKHNVFSKRIPRVSFARRTTSVSVGFHKKNKKKNRIYLFFFQHRVANSRSYFSALRKKKKPPPVCIAVLWTLEFYYTRAFHTNITRRHT